MQQLEEKITELKDQIYHNQIAKMWLYFRLLNEETRAEFIELVSLMFVLSEKPQKLSRQKIQEEVLKRYFVSQNNDDIFYILDFAEHLQKINSVVFKDKLMELIKGFSNNE